MRRSGSGEQEARGVVDAAPFHGLRYDPALAGTPAATSAPAYDDIDALTYASHRTASPYTVLELLTPPDRTGSYHAAGEALRRWRRTGILVTDPVPAFYRYEEHELRRGKPTVQRGVLASVALEPPGPAGAVLTHEAVDAARVAARRARLEALRADLSPVFALATSGSERLGVLLARAPADPPVAALSDTAGVDHRVWAVTDPGEISALRAALAEVRVLVADGHHRYAAALQARTHHRGRAWQRTLMYIVDAAASGPEVLGVHRLVRGVTGAALRRLQDDLSQEPATTDPRDLREHLQATPGRAFGLLLSPALAGQSARAALARPRDEAALATRLPPDRSAAWRALDTALLDHGVLPTLEATAVEYRPDLLTAAADVVASADALLFVVRPLDLSTAEGFAARGEHLPAKSTYFRPKPRAGLVLRALDEE